MVLLDFFHGGLKIISYDHLIVAGVNQLVAQKFSNFWLIAGSGTGSTLRPTSGSSLNIGNSRLIV